MIDILVSGSLAYDRIMDYPGRFRDHILAQKVHILNVSFVVNNVSENFGGTAGNISYNLSLLGEQPILLGVVGDDFLKYEKWLSAKSINCSKLKKISGTLTAGAYIMTDQEDNQITGFYPGPQDEEYPKVVKELFNGQTKISSRPSLTEEGKNDVGVLAIIAPEYAKRMMAYVRIYKELGIPYIFDPGQQITALNGEELREAIRGAKILIGNDYEIQMILEKINSTHAERQGKHVGTLLEEIEILVITKGAEGSEIYHQGNKVTIPAAKAKNISDPTGAGDAYRAGFIKGLLEKWPLEKIGRFAGLIACYTVEKYGTQTHQFTWEELKKRYKENFNEEL